MTTFWGTSWRAISVFMRGSPGVYLRTTCCLPVFRVDVLDRRVSKKNALDRPHGCLFDPRKPCSTISIAVHSTVRRQEWSIPTRGNDRQS